MVINNQSDCKIAKFPKHIKISRMIFKNPPTRNQKPTRITKDIKQIKMFDPKN